VAELAPLAFLARKSPFSTAVRRAQHVREGPPSPEDFAMSIFGSRSRTTPSKDALQITIRWGDTVLDVIELSPPRSFYVGDLAFSTLPVDYTVPGLVEPRFALVTVDGENVVVNEPPALGTASAVREFRLQREEGVDVRVDGLVFMVRRSERAPRCERTPFAADRRVAAFFGASLAAHTAIALSMALFTPPLGLTDDEGDDRALRYLVQQYLDASAEREEKAPPPSDGDAKAGGGAPLPEQGASGAAGRMGKHDSTAHDHRASGVSSGSSTRLAVTREEEISMAQNFGVIGLLATSAVGAHAAFDDLGVGDVAVMGNLFGRDIGESAGSGGLGLSGLGVGGGMRGDTIGLGSIGTCGVNCAGMGDGQGPGTGLSAGRTGGTYVPKTPRVRMAGVSTSDGSLPSSVIQRVVRQNFGRFRACYEDGLKTNPNLEGRVTARFVIARDGSVATVQSGGGDLPDSHVVACVLRAYSSLSFPSPADGIVRVSYPLVFSPSA
jgi:hypothetical protein